MRPYTTAQRLQQLMILRDLRQIDIVRLCEPFCKMHKVKMGRNSISQYVSGKVEPRQNALYILGQALNVSEAWLMGFDVPMERADSPAVSDETSSSNITVIDNKNIYLLPLFESVSAGFGVSANNDILDYVPCYIASESEAHNSLCVKVTGDSMFPKIENGDIVQILKQTSVDSGSIAVVLLDKTEGLVKKVVYGADWIELHSINPMYPVQRFEGKDVLRIEVLGVVKRIIKDV